LGHILISFLSWSKLVRGKLHVREYDEVIRYDLEYSISLNKELSENREEEVKGLIIRRLVKDIILFGLLKILFDDINSGTKRHEWNE
jgi:hypothetical protein